jgi:hypothetical protein
MVDIKFSMFFDKPGVIKHVKDGTESVLSKAGAFTRRTMKGLIRPGKKPAKPGKPPKSHTGIFKDLIYFGYDEKTQSVVIGPKLSKRSQSPTVPELLDRGGTIAHHWKTGKPATYHAFPYVQPALEIEAPKFPELFTNAIK